MDELKTKIADLVSEKARLEEMENELRVQFKEVEEQYRSDLYEYEKVDDEIAYEMDCIERNQRRIEELLKEIELHKNKIKNLEESLELVKTRYVEYSTIEKNHQIRIDEIKKRKSEIDRELRVLTTADFCRDIFGMTKDNTMVVSLNGSTKTTPIMDTFVRSDKQFMKLMSFYHDGKSFSLIIRRGARKFSDLKYLNLRVVQSDITMTILKKAAHNWEMFAAEPRMQPLVECIEKLQLHDHAFEDKRIPFEIPCRIGGQTSANQTGYGSEYHYGELVHQGTLYGETTSFLAIGVELIK